MCSMITDSIPHLPLIIYTNAFPHPSDGITLYFFSSHSKTSKGEYPAFIRYDNIQSGGEVMKQFSNKANQPHGGIAIFVCVFAH